MKAKGSITPLTITQRIAVVIIGLSFIAAGIYTYADIFNFGKGVAKTKGTIVSLMKEESTSRSGNRTTTSVIYRPIVEFTVGDKQYKFLATVASGSYRTGQRIRVNYDPKNPSGSARLAGKKELLFPAVFIACGALAMILGILAPTKQRVIRS
ncbi:MAG: DUF3592 domain-containing protein [Desulfobacteraceae bacterium]|nr:DUF3592 domain-containing protein [Desulfobacteraceae bacterium]